MVVVVDLTNVIDGVAVSRVAERSNSKFAGWNKADESRRTASNSLIRSF